MGKQRQRGGRELKKWRGGKERENQRQAGGDMVRQCSGPPRERRQCTGLQVTHAVTSESLQSCARLGEAECTGNKRGNTRTWHPHDTGVSSEAPHHASRGVSPIQLEAAGVSRLECMVQPQVTVGWPGPAASRPQPFPQHSPARPPYSVGLRSAVPQLSKSTTSRHPVGRREDLVRHAVR